MSPKLQKSSQKPETDSDDFMPVLKDKAVSRAKNTVKKKREDTEKSVDNMKGATVLYIGRIPHGFYENEMRGFFSQFGTIKNLRISRNKKTGKSKHYGFIEFESPEVAKIVADCMHNYLLYEHMLQVHLIPPEKVHPRLWKGSNREFRVVDFRKRHRECHNKVRTNEENEKRLKRILEREEIRRRKIEAAGLDYKCPDIAEMIAPAPKKIIFNEEED
eukprot:TRINITY_DN8539_c0_g1_i1.p1 TRINITY_DN8539_c0_g1~~TRINITY_DN8539_c0_g1_i1.p1  ORF type:complete len:217 (+),score=37.40 TRINITY_DN8539_c0_g1_i1:160-810(+)